MSRGKLITVEGIECVGKTSVLNALKSKYPNAVFSREVGGTEYAEMLRHLLFTQLDKMSPRAEAFTAWAARLDHVDKVIEPALAAGRMVVLDRYYHSTIAYQGAVSDNLEFVDSLQAFLRPLVPNPDLVLWLDADVETMVSRIKARGTVAGEEVNLLEERTFLFERIRSLFEREAQNDPAIMRIDTCIHSIDDTIGIVEKAIETLYKAPSILI